MSWTYPSFFRHTFSGIIPQDYLIISESGVTFFGLDGIFSLFHFFSEHFFHRGSVWQKRKSTSALIPKNFSAIS